MNNNKITDVEIKTKVVEYKQPIIKKDKVEEIALELIKGKYEASVKSIETRSIHDVPLILTPRSKIGYTESTEVIELLLDDGTKIEITRVSKKW